jgi:hypothetical protein
MDIVNKQLNEKKQEEENKRYKAKERGIHLYFPEIGKYGELLLKYEEGWYGEEGRWKVKLSILSKNASVSTPFSNIEPWIETGLFGSEKTINSSDTESFGKYEKALEYFLELFEKHRKNSVAYIDRLTKKTQKRKQDFTINAVICSFSTVITGILIAIAIILSTGNPKLLAVIIIAVIATAIASLALGATLWDNYDKISLLQGRENSAKKTIKKIETIK